MRERERRRDYARQREIEKAAAREREADAEFAREFLAKLAATKTRNDSARPAEA